MSLVNKYPWNVHLLIRTVWLSWGDHPVRHSPSIAFRHLLPNSARFRCVCEWVRERERDCMSTSIPAPSSKLCQISLCHWRGTLYLRAAVHRHGQRPPKGLGTDETGSNLAPKHAHKHEAYPPWVKKKKKRVPSRFKRFWFYLSWCKQHGQL